MINKAILIGNVGCEVSVRYAQNGTPVATFSMATTERRNDKDGQVQDHTEWHRSVAWNRLAEICGEYLGKGSKVYVEGKLQTRKWKDQSGAERYTTEVVIWEMKMLSPRNESAGGGYGDPPPVGEEEIPF